MQVRAGLAAAFATAVGAVAQQPARQPPPLIERVEVSRVVVDARVIDDAGAPIRGLLASDFLVTIGGKPARVEMVVWTGDQPTSTSASADEPVVSRATPKVSSEPGQLVVLLFQKSLIKDRARGFVRMVEQSRELVRSLPASNRVAILQFETSLRIYSDFSSDRDALDRILAHGLLYERPPSSVRRGSPSLVEELTPAIGRKVSTMENAFSAIAHALRPMAGSKAIAYIGYGMGNTPFGIRQDGGAAHARFGTTADDLAHKADMNNEYAKALRLLTEARVSVFSLDISNADTHSLAAGMQVIAADTGGFYAHSLDFPEKPMRFVAGALGGHYVLFVEPPSEPSDRTISVGVTASRRAHVYATSSYKSAVQ